MNRVESPVVKSHEGTYEERELEGKQLVRQDPAAFLELDSPNRRNRAKIHIANDEAAIDAYLEEYKDSPNTKRAYQKELRRFLLWSRDYAHARFEDLMRDDLRSYERWMRSPPGHLIGDTRAPYGTEGWRPFRSALSNDACHHALRVISSFMDWLVQAGYISANPMGLVRQKKARLQNERGDKLRPRKAARHGLTERALQLIRESIEQMPRNTPEQIETAARAGLTIEILLTTGARRSELASATLNNLVCENNKWRLYVVAKGGSVGTLQIGNRVIEAIKEYNACRGLPELPSMRDNKPIIAQLGKPDAGISDNMLYRIVREIMRKAATQAIESGELNAQNQLEQATTHWLRHTAISTVADKTGNVRLTKGFGRHASADTTLGYLNTEDDELHDKVTALFDAGSVPVQAHRLRNNL